MKKFFTSSIFVIVLLSSVLLLGVNGCEADNGPDILTNLPELNSIADNNLSAGAISGMLYSFSPLTQIYLNHLGLQDKNNNGTIDKDSGEGYEEFITKYGNADAGFYTNGVLYGAGNGKLEEPEIINHYYLHIRFNPDFEEETAAIENAVKAYIYANNLPLVWLDYEQGTAMNAANRILGAGWQNKKLTEDEAVSMFRQVTNAMNIRGLFGIPNNTGYYLLPEFIDKKAGYCFEVAQFGFWFFSQLNISVIVVFAALNPSLVHGVVKLNNSNIIIDYFETGNAYKVSVDQWKNLNPVQSIGEYYAVEARSRNNISDAEKSVIYNKYNISNICYLMELYADGPNRNDREIIALGEFFLNNTDIPGMMVSTDHQIGEWKDNFAYILSILVESYSATGNRNGFNNIERLFNQYYRDDHKVKPFLDKYRF